jgi:hypothetical protein
MVIVNVIQITFQPQKTVHTIAKNAQQSMDQDMQQIMGKIAYVILDILITGLAISVSKTAIPR